MRFWKFFFLLLMAFNFTLDDAKAQNNNCTLETDGTITFTGDEIDQIRRCEVPLRRAQFTIKRYGYCDGEPNQNDGFSNCYSLIDAPIDFDLDTSMLTESSVNLPPPGNYSHYFVVLNKRLKLSALLEFSQANVVFSEVGDAQNIPFVSSLFQMISYTLDDCPYTPITICEGSYFEINYEETARQEQPGHVRNIQSLPHEPLTDVPLSTLYWQTFGDCADNFKPAVTDDNLGITFRLVRDIDFEQARSCDEVGNIMFGTELATPFAVTGQETSAEAVFNLDLAGSIGFKKIPLSNIRERNTNNLITDETFWYPFNIMLGKNALMPEITLSSD